MRISSSTYSGRGMFSHDPAAGEELAHRFAKSFAGSPEHCDAPALFLSSIEGSPRYLDWHHRVLSEMREDMARWLDAGLITWDDIEALIRSGVVRDIDLNPCPTEVDRMRRYTIDAGLVVPVLPVRICVLGRRVHGRADAARRSG